MFCVVCNCKITIKALYCCALSHSTTARMRILAIALVYTLCQCYIAIVANSLQQLLWWAFSLLVEVKDIDVWTSKRDNVFGDCTTMVGYDYLTCMYTVKNK